MKLTKAQGRKRLREARHKVNKVLTYLEQELTTREYNDLLAAKRTMLKIEMKLK